jgi:hypothetical protein
LLAAIEGVDDLAQVAPETTDAERRSAGDDDPTGRQNGLLGARALYAPAWAERRVRPAL